MDKKLVKRYIKGWKEAACLEEMELISLSDKDKFKKIISIFQLGMGLGIKPVSDDDNVKVLSRWCLLKAGY